MLQGLPPYYSDSLRELFKNIKKANLVFHRTISPTAQDLIRKLMAKNPLKRPKIGSLKSHLFFREIDW